MKRNAGFTLLIVLVFLQIFALLTLDSLTQSALFAKAAFNQYQTGNLQRSAEDVLRQLEKQPPQGCLITPLPAANLKKLTVSWWQAQACKKTLPNTVFYYVWELLERDTCCSVQQKNTVVVFYRLSLLAVQRNTELLLQSTIAIPTNEKPVCNTKPFSIVPGRQMYREIK